MTGSASSSAAESMLIEGNPAAKWLFIDGAPSFGGHEVMLLRWIEELIKARQVMPRLIARQGSRLEQNAPPVILAGSLPVQQKHGIHRLTGLWNELQALGAWIRFEKPDVCVFASGSLGDQLPHVTWARLLGYRVMVYVPLLDTFSEMGYRSAKWKDLFVRKIYARIPSAWIAISEIQASHFRSWARPQGPVHVLSNTVGLQFETVQRLAPREIPPGDPIRVLVLGRMDAAQKGLDMLVEHLARAPAEQLSQWQIAIVGEGPYRETLEGRLRESSTLAKCVSLDRWRPTAEIMADYDLLLLPSRFEGVPLVMLEAMAMGLPVVASDLPGTQTYVLASCRFPVGDIARAFEIVTRLFDVDERRKLSVTGRALYEQHASSTAFARGVKTLSKAITATS